MIEKELADYLLPILVKEVWGEKAEISIAVIYVKLIM